MGTIAADALGMATQDEPITSGEMMRPHLFTGADLRAVLKAAATELGEDAAIVRWRTIGTGTGKRAEVIAVRGDEVDRFRALIDPAVAPDSPGSRELRAGDAPLKIALVGPTGAGKTTTVAKLALNPLAFGGRKVGLLTIDTFRVGAVEQIQMYADVAGLPLEVVYDVHEVPRALSRLRDCEVVIIDTPGRGPRASEAEFEWRSMLSAIEPDEVHLVLQSTVRFDVADFVRDSYLPTRVTHALFTKLDELPVEATIVGLASRLGLRSRWLTDGQVVPADLKMALPRMLDSLGQFNDGGVTAPVAMDGASYPAGIAPPGTFAAALSAARPAGAVA
jgi:flagellar biosynthesis protein FlhF